MLRNLHAYLQSHFFTQPPPYLVEKAGQGGKMIGQWFLLPQCDSLNIRVVIEKTSNFKLHPLTAHGVTFRPWHHAVKHVLHFNLLQALGAQLVEQY